MYVLVTNPTIQGMRGPVRKWRENATYKLNELLYFKHPENFRTEYPTEHGKIPKSHGVLCRGKQLELFDFWGKPKTENNA